MSSSNKSNISTGDIESRHLVATYYPFTLVIVGTLLNLFTFIIFFRPIFRDTNRRPTIHYMRTIAIFDILMLYGWNLDHYFSGAYGFTVQTYSIPLCKFFSFYSYFAMETSAWLRVFISFDRYLSSSRLHKTWFSRSKSVLIVIACILIVVTVINCHILLFGCFYNDDGTVNIESRLYQVYPQWDDVNLVLYNCLPLILMVTFNSGVIYHLVRLRQTTTVQNSRIQHRSITITFITTTFLFSIMTIPSSVAFGFFYDTTGFFMLHLLDSILYTYHVLSFPLYLITFTEFRQEVLRLIAPNRWNRIQPTTIQLTIRR